jgi:NAD-dependent deacetylase
VLDEPDIAARLCEVVSWLEATYRGEGLIVALTGAGVSAESGIPTFRGEEGYWKIGSRNYFPEELATRAAFAHMPHEIWGWYLYRRSVCRAASPNAGHLALAELERTLSERGQGDRLLLITQNVDGLHLRAGSSPARTFEIHGNIDFMRSVDPNDARVFPLPKALGEHWERGKRLEEAHRALLVTPEGAPTRPHVLWFDETYDETHYRFESALSAIERAALLLVVGTSGATNLPTMLVRRAAARAVPLLVLNRDPSPFSRMAESIPKGHFVQGAAGELLPYLVDVLLDGASALAGS